MKIYLLIFFVIILSACGEFKRTDIKPRPCTVSDTSDGAAISCPDGSSEIIHDGNKGDQGNPGNNGSDGEDGANGHSMVFETSTANNCPNDGYTVLMAVDLNDNQQLDLNDGNLSSVTLCNGSNAGPTPFTPVGVINPCGDAQNVFDEVLLKLNNGMILASFSDDVNGKNTRFSLLTSGNYMTTDESQCHFHVDSSGNVSW